MGNQESRAEIILGVDTHLDVHVGAVTFAPPAPAPALKAQALTVQL